MTEHRKSICLVASLLVAPWGVRIALLCCGTGFQWRWTDLRGFAGDLTLALLLSAALTPLTRLNRWAPLPLVLLWALFHYANHEFILGLDGTVAMAYVHHMADAAFLEGSVSALHDAWFGTLLVSVSLGLAAWTLRTRPKILWKHCTALGLSLSLVFLVWPYRLDVGGWRQNNPLAEVLRWSVLYSPPTLPPPPSQEPADLTGKPRFPLNRVGHNVLIILLESTSGSHIGAIAAANGRTSDVLTPNLDRWASRGVTYSNVVASQRQTNRGLYSVLCGDYPRITTDPPRMEEIAVQGHRRCLAAVLRDHGYRTLFAQTAPLEFQSIGPFMKAAGFDEVVDPATFAHSYASNHWGVDDQAFFEQAARHIHRTDSHGEPWFITLITSGNHHPFTAVPPDFHSLDYPTVGPRRTLAYSDHAVGWLLDHLLASGVLDDTLVILASDESSGMLSDPSDRSRVLAQNWGFLISHVPDVPPQMISSPHMLPDIAASVLDYLGIQETKAVFVGRSLFREYDRPRTLALGSTYLHAVGGLDAQGYAWLCLEDLSKCQRWAVPDQRLFSWESTGATAQPAAPPEFLREQVARSLAPLEPGVR
jgi:hypothetical protein